MRLFYRIALRIDAEAAEYECACKHPRRAGCVHKNSPEVFKLRGCSQSVNLRVNTRLDGRQHEHVIDGTDSCLKIVICYTNDDIQLRGALIYHFHVHIAVS